MQTHEPSGKPWEALGICENRKKIVKNRKNRENRENREKLQKLLFKASSLYSV